MAIHNERVFRKILTYEAVCFGFWGVYFVFPIHLNEAFIQADYHHVYGTVFFLMLAASGPLLALPLASKVWGATWRALVASAISYAAGYAAIIVADGRGKFLLEGGKLVYGPELLILYFIVGAPIWAIVIGLASFYINRFFEREKWEKGSNSK